MDYQELIERLRDTNKHTFALWFDAADAIESILAENERLNAECDEWEANSKQWEQEYYKKDTELAKYCDAPVVAYLYKYRNCFGDEVWTTDHNWGNRIPFESKPLIVKPDENQ